MRTRFIDIVVLFLFGIVLLLLPASAAGQTQSQAYVDALTAHVEALEAAIAARDTVIAAQGETIAWQQGRLEVQQGRLEGVGGQGAAALAPLRQRPGGAVCSADEARRLRRRGRSGGGLWGGHSSQSRSQTTRRVVRCGSGGSGRLFLETVIDVAQTRRVYSSRRRCRGGRAIRRSLSCAKVESLTASTPPTCGSRGSTARAPTLSRCIPFHCFHALLSGS